MAEKCLPSESLLSETRRLLQASGLRAKKGLAQHFLISRDVLHKIVTAAELSLADIVMEIGPGLGVLTQELAARSSRLIAVELDEKLVTVLKDRLADFPNFTVVHGDIMEIDPGDLLRQQTDLTPPYHYKIVANLPYYITSAVLRHCLEATIQPELLVIMVQKEIAQQITAKPGAMSLLSVSIQFYGRPKIISYVPAGCFFPAPKVDSAILGVEVFPEPAVPVKDADSFFRLVRAGFSASRKQIINSLAHGLNLPKNDIAPILEAADISATRRAETLSLTEWGKLYQTYLAAAVSTTIE